jgi:predicted glycosyltransferase
MTDGLDYVKLPCISRDARGDIGVKYLKLNLESMVILRRELIYSTVMNLKPDIFLVDKKPGGVAGELEESLHALKSTCPHTAILLLLRDILDDGTATIDQWKRQHAYELLQAYYHKILVVGVPELFDVREEYRFPAAIGAKVQFCGYIRREPDPHSRETIRRQLQIFDADTMVLVTAGGGEDGYNLMRTYLEGIGSCNAGASIKSVIVTGPELAEPHKHEIQQLAERYRCAAVIEFTDQMMNYLDAADVVVSMAGYNTVCEILSLRKRAVIVPRVEPVQEQKIRAERMARLGLFRMINPRALSPRNLMDAVTREAEAVRTAPAAPAALALDALPRITTIIRDLVGCEPKTSSPLGMLASKGR